MCSAVTRPTASSCVRAIDLSFVMSKAILRAARARTLPDAGLEHPELALLDRELGVAHVAVVVLEPGEDAHQLFVDGRETALQLGERLGVADAGDDVLALRVDQEVAVLALLACRRVAGEPHSRARALVAVAEHHRLHVDRRARDRPGCARALR